VCIPARLGEAASAPGEVDEEAAHASAHTAARPPAHAHIVEEPCVRACGGKANKVGGEGSRARERGGENDRASAYHAVTRPPARADVVVEPRAPVGRYADDHAASCADGCADG
jgi:hypothetical protein